MAHSKKRLSVVMAAAECAPFAKVGGLADVVGSLPLAIAREGLRVAVVLPKYGFIERKFRLTLVHPRLVVEIDGKKETCALYTARRAHDPVRYYFIEHPYFAGDTIYLHSSRIQKNSALAYTRSVTDIIRFSIFSKAVIEAIHQAAIPCDLIHCHDWHTALLPVFADQLAVTKSYLYSKTVFTIHNLANQGIAARNYLKRLGLIKDATPALLEDYYDRDAAQLNSMKLGILAADIVTTVSPTYAREILTPAYGAGLAPFLRRRRKDLYGIINGIDLALYNPRSDSHLFRNYSQKTWRRRKPYNKQRLQQLLALPVRPVPVYAVVSRLVRQKGFDILEMALKQFLTSDVQLVILGAGDPSIELSLSRLARTFPGKCALRVGFDAALAQRIYAGSDFFLMPSRYEPCGLGQMIAMRYGSVPIVRATGGLSDTVHAGKTGMVFREYTPAALLKTLYGSLKLYGKKKSWYTMVSRCMRQEFSWKKSAREYVRLYRQLI